MAHPFAYVVTETLSGARTLTAAEVANTSVFSFDPGGSARTITLPAEATSAGQVLFIANTADGAEVITVENDGTDTIVTPTQNESAIVFCDGVAWYGIAGANS